MLQVKPCPLCGTKVEYEHISRTQEEYVRAPDEDWYKIYCYNVCGPFAVEESLQALLDSSENTRLILSRFTRNFYNLHLSEGDLVTLHRTWVDQILQTHRIAEVAVAQFGFLNVHLEPTGGADWINPTYIVEKQGQKFVLRLHEPATEKDEIRSLLFWLSSLRHETGLVVPEAVSRPDGSFIQQFSAEGELRYCVLYRWLEGTVLKSIPYEHRTPKMIENLGIYIARLHQHAASFDPPSWFTRPRYGLQAFREELEQCCTDDALSENERAELRQIGEKRLQLMEELGEGPEVFGLIHYDLWAKNILVHGEEVCLIDFQETAWGYYLSNIAHIHYRTFHQQEPRIFLKAYKQVRPLPNNLKESIKIFTAARRIGGNARWM